MDKSTEILELLKIYIAQPSLTGTSKEICAEKFLLDYLKALPYFKEHPQYCGLAPVKNDTFNRSVVYGLVKGKSNKTVIYMNHHDVVSTTCYGALEPLAYDAEKVSEALKEGNTSASLDFSSGEWLGGRGSCDMKGGTATQLINLKEYATEPLDGSLLFLSVPDEESYSTGMREALNLLQELKVKYGLEYVFALNSEPNEKRDNTQVVPVGSVGKILATVLIQGKSVHLGHYQTGLNPLGVMAHLIASTEGKKSLEETEGAECTIPPVWLKARDQKDSYDVSLPARASGYCSFQAFHKGPEDILNLLKEELNSAAERFASSQPLSSALPLYTYEELEREYSTKEGFAEWKKNTLAELTREINTKGLPYPEATIKYLNGLLDFSDNLEPLAVIALAPPYYPATNSRLMEKPVLDAVLSAISKESALTFEEYFLGVSDCSYLGNTIGKEDSSFETNAPLWGEAYSFDQKALGKLQIPFLLLGPWGKDLHQKTERVNIKSLTKELPKLLQLATKAAWNS